MLKIPSTLPNQVNICLPKSTACKIYPICKSDEDFCVEFWEDRTDELSIVFNPKAVINDTFIRNLSIICNSIVRVDASQLYPFSICQDMPTGL